MEPATEIKQADQRGFVGDGPGAAIPAQVSLQPDQLVVVGAVRAPGTVLSTADLNRRARGPMSVHYSTRTSDEVHSVYGVALYDVLAGVGLAQREEPKMDYLSFAVLAHGQDGYQVLLSWAELDPEFGACAALLATRYNGGLLPRPTLVMPRDSRASRYVRLVDRLHVVRWNDETGERAPQPARADANPPQLSTVD